MWIKFKKNIGEILQDFGANSSLVEKVIIAFLIGVILIQFGQRAALLYESRKSFAVAVALNDDIGNAIEVAQRTRLWKQNDWHAYGPLYYRIVHVLKYGMYGSSENEIEDQKDHHFVMMLLSLISVFGLSLFLGFILTKSWIGRLTFAIFLTEGFLLNETWILMIYACKVETFCVLISAIACKLTIDLYSDFESKKSLRRAGGAWAFAFLTKLSVIYYIPSLFLLFVSKFKWQKNSLKNFWNRAKPFLGAFCLVYFVIGFPQSFFIGPALGNILSQSKNMQPIDLEAFLEWLRLIANHLKWPMIIFLISSLIFPLNFESKLKISNILKSKKMISLLSFLILPMLFLVSRKNVVDHQWYPMTYLGGLFVLSIFFLQLLPEFKIIHQSKYVRFGLPLILVFMILPRMDREALGIQKIVHAQIQACSAEAEQVRVQLTDLNREGKNIVLDPFLPRLKKQEIKPGTTYRLIWNQTWDKVKDLNPDVLALRSSWYGEEYFSPTRAESFRTRYGEEALSASQSYYSHFRAQKDATLPDGSRWSKTYTDSCGFEIWLKSETQP